MILGCTHYPIMADTIKKVLNPNTQMIFSGETVGNKLFEHLDNNGLFAKSNNNSKIEFYVSDLPQKFETLGQQFFGAKLNNVKQISID